jgi:hypothetical protein
MNLQENFPEYDINNSFFIINYYQFFFAIFTINIFLIILLN